MAVGQGWRQSGWEGLPTIIVQAEPSRKSVQENSYRRSKAAEYASRGLDAEPAEMHSARGVLGRVLCFPPSSRAEAMRQLNPGRAAYEESCAFGFFVAGSQWLGHEQVPMEPGAISRGFTGSAAV